jgi:hypothetical protein
MDSVLTTTIIWPCSIARDRAGNILGHSILRPAKVQLKNESPVQLDLYLDLLRSRLSGIRFYTGGSIHGGRR